MNFWQITAKILNIKKVTSSTFELDDGLDFLFLSNKRGKKPIIFSEYMTLFQSYFSTQKSVFVFDSKKERNKKKKDDVTTSFAKVFKCFLLDFLILILIHAQKKERRNAEIPAQNYMRNAKKKNV